MKILHIKSARKILQNKKELEDSYKQMFGRSLQEAYEEAGGEGIFDLQDADTQAHDFHNEAAKGVWA